MANLYNKLYYLLNHKNEKMFDRKTQIWISAILYTFIIIVSLVIVLEVINPIMRTYKDRAIYESTKNQLINLNDCIKTVASSLPGTTKICSMNYNKGTCEVGDDYFKCILQTGGDILYPGTRVKFGDLYVLSSANVNASYVNNSIIIQNQYLLVNITKIGSETNYSYINTSQIINYFYLKPLNKKTEGTFDFIINENPSHSIGNGYTKLLDVGDGLDRARVKVHVNSTNISYNMFFTLISNSDFLKVEIGDVTYG